MCSFTNLNNDGPLECRDIPGSGCVMPFGDKTLWLFYGYWKLRE